MQRADKNVLDQFVKGEKLTVSVRSNVALTIGIYLSRPRGTSQIGRRTYHFGSFHPYCAQDAGSASMAAFATRSKMAHKERVLSSQRKVNIDSIAHILMTNHHPQLLEVCAIHSIWGAPSIQTVETAARYPQAPSYASQLEPSSSKDTHYCRLHTHGH